MSNEDGGLLEYYNTNISTYKLNFQDLIENSSIISYDNTEIGLSNEKRIKQRTIYVNMLKFPEINILDSFSYGFNNDGEEVIYINEEYLILDGIKLNCKTKIKIDGGYVFNNGFTADGLNSGKKWIKELVIDANTGNFGMLLLGNKEFKLISPYIQDINSVDFGGESYFFYRDPKNQLLNCITLCDSDYFRTTIVSEKNGKLVTQSIKRKNNIKTKDEKDIAKQLKEILSNIPEQDLEKVYNYLSNCIVSGDFSEIGDSIINKTLESNLRTAKISEVSIKKILMIFEGEGTTLI